MKGLTPGIGLLALAAGFGLQGVSHAAAEFTDHKTGGFYHVLSGLAVGYDLDADTALAASDPDSRKDFVNNDVQGDFTGKWKAGNSTTFVNAPGYPTFNAQTGSPDFTFAKVDSLFKAGTPITQQDNPGTGSKHVYLAKLRGGATYVIVKFLTRDGSNNECSCANKGITTFEYWKIPSSSGGTTNLQAVTLSRPASRIRLGNGSGLLVVDRNGKLSGGLQIVNALGQPLPHQAALFKNLPR
jgi:hypothetical protein